MANNEMAKEAAIRQINKTKESIMQCIINDYNMDKTILPKISFIKSKIDEYSLGESFFKEIIDSTYQDFLTYRRYADAEEFAKKYEKGGEKTTINPKNYIRLELAFPIAMTIIFGIIFFCIIFFAIELNWIISIILTAIYMVSHPYIGKGFYEVSLEPCKQIDKAFELKDKDSWTKWLTYNALYFSALWPVFGPIFLIISTIGAVFGTIFKKLFFGK